MVGRIPEDHPKREVANQLWNPRGFSARQTGEKRAEAVGGHAAVQANLTNVLVASEYPCLQDRTPVRRILVAQPSEERERIGAVLAATRVVDGLVQGKRALTR